MTAGAAGSGSGLTQVYCSYWLGGADRFCQYEDTRCGSGYWCC